MLGEQIGEETGQVTGTRVLPDHWIDLVASSSRSQRAMWPTTTLTLPDLPCAVRGRPLASAGLCGGCYSISYSPRVRDVAAVVYSSVDETARTAMERLAVGGMDDRFPCWPRHETEQVVELVPATT
jgi:hypothetical protein